MTPKSKKNSFAGLGVEREFHVVFNRPVETKDDQMFIRKLGKSPADEIPIGTWLSPQLLISQIVDLDSGEDMSGRPIDLHKINVCVVDGKVYMGSNINETILERTKKLVIIGNMVDNIYVFETSNIKQRDAKKTLTAMSKVKWDHTAFDIEWDNCTAMYEVRSDRFRNATPASVLREIDKKQKSLISRIAQTPLSLRIAERFGELRVDDSCCQKKYVTVNVVENDIVPSIVNIPTFVFINKCSEMMEDYSGSTHVWVTLPYPKTKKTAQNKIKWSREMSVFVRAIQWLEPVLIASTSTGKESLRHKTYISRLGTIDPSILDLSIPHKHHLQPLSNNPLIHPISPELIGQRYFGDVPSDIRIHYNYNELSGEWAGVELRFMNNMPHDRLHIALEMIEDVAHKASTGTLNPSKKNVSSDARWRKISEAAVRGDLIPHVDMSYLVSKSGLNT